jgi:hypothetical protein
LGGHPHGPTLQSAVAAENAPDTDSSEIRRQENGIDSSGVGRVPFATDCYMA